MMQQWLMNKIEAVKGSAVIIVEDPHKILSKNDQKIKDFAENSDYIAIFAATNLIFRELMHHVQEDEKEKILFIDQTPPTRKELRQTRTRAPPVFYPDLVEKVSTEAHIHGDVQKYLIETTNDTGWPAEANSREYAKIIIDNLENVIEAYEDLRKIDNKRFSDEDFKKIIAFSALGLPRAAFSQPSPAELWKLGFVHRKGLQALEKLSLDAVKIIKNNLQKADKPFCWLAEDPSKATKVYYLSLLLAQHYPNWDLLLVNIDDSLRNYRGVSIDTVKKSSKEILIEYPSQSMDDISEIEKSLTKNDLQLLFQDQKNIMDYNEYSSIIENESYSPLFHSLAILAALNDLLSLKYSPQQYEKIYEIIINPEQEKFIHKSESKPWNNLKEIYQLLHEIQNIRKELSVFLKTLKVKPIDQITFDDFWIKWNQSKINRLEYYFSTLERNIEYEEEFIPCKKENLPNNIGALIPQIKETIEKLSIQTETEIEQINDYFQDLIQIRYPEWVKNETGPILTSEFIKKCLRPNWDPMKEKAVIFIFDGMRYDIWDEYLKPIISDYTILEKEFPASSILPTETQITRKAISAGTYPDKFNTGASENELLTQSLEPHYDTRKEIKYQPSEGLATGETVRYSGPNLDVYIFELCDKDLHNISNKYVNGREIPARPLSLIYEQIRNVIEKEVIGIIRRLEPGTKIFITADHGFRRVNRERIPVNSMDLNNPYDCNYLNCKLAVPLQRSNIPTQFHKHIIRFNPNEIRLPEVETNRDRTGNTTTSHITEIIFPITKYSFERPIGRFDPPAWSHGGISLQEMIIPMIVLTTINPESGAINIEIENMKKIYQETEEITFNIKLIGRPKTFADEIRIDLDASINTQENRIPLGTKIAYIRPWEEQKIHFTHLFNRDEITESELKIGEINAKFTLTTRYHYAEKTHVKTDSTDFIIKLNTERIVRRVGALGNILGLTPKKTGKIGA